METAHPTSATEQNNKEQLFANEKLVQAGWYVAARSKEVKKNSALRVPMLGKEFVVFRDECGKVAVLRNQCPHMGAPLSHGTVVDGCIRCPFHGFTYDKNGQCVAMPANEELKSRYNARAYITEERWGQIWFFYGTNPNTHLDDLSTLENVTQFHFKRWRYKIHFHSMVPNAMDITHFRAVHGLTCLSCETTETENEITAHMKFRAEKNAPLVFKLLGYKELEIRFKTVGANNYFFEVLHPAKFTVITSYCQHNEGGTWSASVVCVEKFGFFKKWTGLGFVQTLLQMKAVSDFFSDDECWANHMKFQPRFIPADEHYIAYRNLCNRQKVAGLFSKSP